MTALIVEEEYLTNGRREVTTIPPGHMAVTADEFPEFRVFYAFKCSPDGLSSSVMRYDFESHVPVEDAKRRVFRGQHSNGIPIAVLRAWDSCYVHCNEPERKITAKHQPLQEVA
jgi:hypothetical protein